MKCTRIDMDSWDRGKLFQFYINNMRIVMSLTVEISVTPLDTYIKDHHLKFYPSMLWVVSRVINAHDEFKYSWDEEGHLIKWDSVSPS